MGRVRWGVEAEPAGSDAGDDIFKNSLVGDDRAEIDLELYPAGPPPGETRSPRRGCLSWSPGTASGQPPGPSPPLAAPVPSPTKGRRRFGISPFQDPPGDRVRSPDPRNEAISRKAPSVIGLSVRNGSRDWVRSARNPRFSPPGIVGPGVRRRRASPDEPASKVLCRRPEIGCTFTMRSLPVANLSTGEARNLPRISMVRLRRLATAKGGIPSKLSRPSRLDPLAGGEP